MAATPDFANNPLVKASGGKITAAQVQAYYAQHGSLPNWREGPEGPILNSSTAKALGYTNPGTMQSLVGTSASKAATAGQPGTGVGSVYAPAAVTAALDKTRAGMQGASQLGGSQQLADLYTNAGVLNMMSQGANNPTAPAPTAPVSQTPGIGLPGPASPPVPDPGPIPARGRSNSLPPSTGYPGQPMPDASPEFPQGPVPTPGVNFNSIQDFSTWFAGNGPRMEGDLGSIYNMPKPITTPAGEYLMPGMLGKTFGKSDTLLPERVQAYQLQHEQQPFGAISPMMPPWLVSQAGFGPEDVLGGQWSQGQVAAADPSLQGNYTAGAHNWWQSQTPTGPYAGHQFPNVPTALPPGSPTNYNPFPGFNLPGGGGSSGSPTTPGGGGGGTGSGGTVPPPSGGGAPNVPPASQVPPITPPGQGGGSPYGSSVDQALAYNAGDVGYLRNIAENAGYPVDVTPAWQDMIAAQERQQRKNFGNLSEAFNVMGGRFSTAFGDAATDYWTQSTKDQNATLSQMSLQALTDARNRELSAASTLGGFGQSGLSQLSSQDFQSRMQADQQAYQMALQLTGNASQAAQLMSQLSAAGGQALYGTEVGAMSQEAQRQIQLQQMLNDAGINISQLWQSNLGLGSQLGQQEYGIYQDQINRQIEEWMRTQPQYNPLLSYIFSAATGAAPVINPGYRPSAWEQILAAGIGAAGAIGGGFAGGN